MTEFDLRSLLQELYRRDLRFVVIGGVAVGAHGYVRATADLDLVPDPDPENLDRFVEALGALGATLPTAQGRRFNAVEDGPVIKRGGNVTADTEFGALTSSSLPKGCPVTRSSSRMPSRAICWACRCESAPSPVSAK